ncbi:UDP-N-acetylmuramoyl-tripeptide--D-alanyl-D-alanine ligase [Patescibacteria group bacterium]|nr:UDP-N-acetylmuramoyl-tripeptide--D-alanyl-D-alanine ligase [Patescibacteria group bacterium]
MKKIFKKIIVSILTLEARLVLKKYKPKIVAVTGSVGKTTAKDSIYTVLSASFFVRKSEKSFNSEIGVPLSVLGCQNGGNNPAIWFKDIFEGLLLILFKNHYPKWLVLEVGADHPGDIVNIARWLKPDIAVITRFAEIPAHVEFFSSPKDIIKEKKQLAKYLKKDGFLILNYDDEDVLSMKNEFNKKTVTYGLNEGADVMGSNTGVLYENNKASGVTFKANHKGSCVPVNTKGILGITHIYPALAAIAVGSTQGLNVVEMSQSLSGEHKAQPGRMRLIDGIKDSLIIDDSYNSSPLAVQTALETLSEIETNGRKIAVLGDMMELGKYTVDSHKKIGELSAGICDILVTVGVRSKDTAKGALGKKMTKKNVIEFEDSKKAGEYLKKIIEKGDVILVKGSRWAMRMEKTVEEIMAEPERADKLLVR